MYCPSCGTQHPESANFCMNCGLALNGMKAPGGQLAPRLRWEYQDLVIPLDVHEKDYRDGNPYSHEYANRIILRHLQHAGSDGWQAEGPTTFQSLWQRGKVRFYAEAVWEGIFRNRYNVYESVTVRLRRLVHTESATPYPSL